MAVYIVKEVSPSGAEVLREEKVEATTPEGAALLMLDEVLTRNGTRTQLRAKVYFSFHDGPPSMVRLYGKSLNPPARSAP